MAFRNPPKPTWGHYMYVARAMLEKCDWKGQGYEDLEAWLADMYPALPKSERLLHFTKGMVKAGHIKKGWNQDAPS